ncbi:hypothetical protein GK047_22570 [Paenibacillus sp. SYP-B3998]|uniref:Uncharacterized protein n=1 Tax=Paenibacillus sp. SYP-B3998 TaxID=2678564 RepID=A0A6G4A4B6_9BACL|nr:hypothetical protein [Paenibacillus sp. SYP-B3998]NEW08784.1 hypothetical protein [Paenibacillus sp. SYP-B3998]
MAPKGKGGKVTKKKELSSRVQYTMRLVESATCEVCKQQCARGLKYLDIMSGAGAVGKGVPCILTRKPIN